MVVVSFVFVWSCDLLATGETGFTSPQVLDRRKQLSVDGWLNDCVGSWRVWLPEISHMSIRHHQNLVVMLGPLDICSNPCQISSYLAVWASSGPHTHKTCLATAIFAVASSGPKRTCKAPNKTLPWVRYFSTTLKNCFVGGVAWVCCWQLSLTVDIIQHSEIRVWWSIDPNTSI